MFGSSDFWDYMHFYTEIESDIVIILQYMNINITHGNRSTIFMLINGFII